jgi:hypothetical protein
MGRRTMHGVESYPNPQMIVAVGFISEGCDPHGRLLAPERPGLVVVERGIDAMEEVDERPKHVRKTIFESGVEKETWKRFDGGSKGADAVRKGRGC